MPSVTERLTAALADRYRIERELGQGGMATVYLAHDVRHDRKVAIKVLKPELAAVLGAERFVVEIRTTAALSHPHILPLFDSGAVSLSHPESPRSGGDGPSLLYYVMPYIQGETIREKLNRETQFGVDEAVRIAREVADALDYAHRHGVIHRDIKPENILLHDGRALVMDFGIALAVSAAAGGRMTETGLSLGTPHYMSPEQATADKELSGRSDVYSLATVLYEMCTGQPPHLGASAQQIIMKIIAEPAPPVTTLRKSVPPNVAAALAKALEKLPADRFESAKAFADALANASFATATVASTATAPAVTRSVSWPVFAATAAVAVVSLAIAGWNMTHRPASPVRPVTRADIVLGRVSLVASPFLVISPDGSRLAFAGTDSAGVRHIYVRFLDRAEPEAVAGTVAATQPFFSPDGDAIGFYQDGRLRTVSLRGGTVNTLATWNLPGGATWGSDHTIVFSSGSRLFRVPAAGGTPEPFSARTGIFRPHFLPGARAVLAETNSPTGMVAIRPGDTTVTTIAPSGSFPQYIEPDLLVYGTIDGALMVAPFDAQRLRVTGPAEPLTDHVMVDAASISRFAVARTGTVAYIAGSVERGRELVMVDRAGKARTLPVGKRLYRFPRFSPDGHQLAFHVELRGNVSGDIWRYSLDNGALLHLTVDSTSAQPEWDPDGKSLIFLDRPNEPSLASLALFRISADGSDAPQQVLQRPVNIYESHVTPDRRTIVFREDAGPNNRDILMAPLDSPTAVRPVVATAFDEKGIAMSPDGQWIAYVSNENGQNDVYIRRLQSSGSRWLVSQIGGTEPRWSQRGEVFFRHGDSVFVTRVELGAEPHVQPPRLLFSGKYASACCEPLWDVSPDGSTFVFVRDPGVASSPPITLLMNWSDRWPSRK